MELAKKSDPLLIVPRALGFANVRQALDANYEARLHTATPAAIDQYLQRVVIADSLAVVFED